MEKKLVIGEIVDAIVADCLQEVKLSKQRGMTSAYFDQGRTFPTPKTNNQLDDILTQTKIFLEERFGWIVKMHTPKVKSPHCLNIAMTICF